MAVIHVLFVSCMIVNFILDYETDDIMESRYGGTVGLCWNDNYSSTHICKYIY